MPNKAGPVAVRKKVRRKAGQKKDQTKKLAAINKAMSQLKFAYRLARKYHMDSSSFDIAMAQIAVAYRNLEVERRALSIAVKPDDGLLAHYRALVGMGFQEDFLPVVVSDGPDLPVTVEIER